MEKFSESLLIDFGENQGLHAEVENTVNLYSANVLKFSDDLHTKKIRFSSLINKINFGVWQEKIPDNLVGNVLLKKHRENSLYDRVNKVINYSQIDEYLLIDGIYRKNLEKLFKNIDDFCELGIIVKAPFVGYRGESCYSYSMEN